MESTEGESQGQMTPQEEPASQTNTTISDQSGRTRTHHTGVVPAKFTRLNTSGNIAENWKLFHQRWENHVILSGLDERSDRFQVATFLSLIDDDALKVYNGFQFGTPERDRSVSEIIPQFERYSIGETNETYERFVFNNRQQNKGETFESFLASIRLLIRLCNYCDSCTPSILRDRIVLGVRSMSLQTALLKKGKLNLTTAIAICKASENATIQHEQMKGKPVKKLSRERGKMSLQNCKYCGGNHPKTKAACPAFGKVCSTCGRGNRFAAVCHFAAAGKQKTDRSKHTSSKQWRGRSVGKTKQVQEDSSDDDAWLYALHSRMNKEVKSQMLIDGKRVLFQLDTGAIVNTLPRELVGEATMKPYHGRLRMWNNDTLKPAGTCRKLITNPKNGKQYDLHFIVFDGAECMHTPLLSLDTGERMNLITVNEEEFDTVRVLRKVQATEMSLTLSNRESYRENNTSPSTQASSQWSCQADEFH